MRCRPQGLVGDYAVSREYNRIRLEKFLSEHPEVDREIVLANEKSMDRFLTLICGKFGSTEGYFDQMGLSVYKEAIRKKLTGE